MIVEGFLLWLALWAIFLGMSTLGRKGWVFGAVAGIWAILLGAFVLVDGIQIQNGLFVRTVNNTTVVNYSYSNLVLPVSTYSYIWGLFFVLIGMYLLFISILSRKRG